MRDTVWNADATESCAGDKQPGQSGEVFINRGDLLKVADLVLRVKPWPAVDSSQAGFAGNSQKLREVAVRRIDELGVGPIQDVRVSSTTKEAAEQDMSFRGPMWPLRRHPGPSHQRQLPLGAGDDEPGPVKPMADGVRGIAQGHRCCR
jgi:hypothetical protein